MEEKKKSRFGLHTFLPALLLFVLIGSPFAANEWQPAVAASLMIAVFLISVAYMVVHFLRLEAFKPILQDEIGQVFTTVAIVAVLLLGAGYIDGLMKSAVLGTSQADTYCTETEGQFYCDTLTKNGNSFEAPQQDIRDWALMLNKNNQVYLSERIYHTQQFVNRIGEQSSQSGMCNMLGIGFTIAGCTSWGVLRTPAGQLLNAQAFATMDLQAEKILLELAKSVMLPLLLPIGIFLRAIYFTRQAGSALIALCLSFYFIFPSMVLLGQAMADGFIAHSEEQRDVFYSKEIDPNTGAISCDPFSPDAEDLQNQMNGLIKGNPPLDEKIIFLTLGRYALMTALALTVTLAAVGGLGHALGTDINVMSIARLS